MRKNNPYRFIFAAGGTGGHLFPAVAVADKLKELQPSAEILFVGTSKKLESTVIPKMGYLFKSIWISGFSRKMKLSNFLFPIKMLVAGLQSLFINFSFKPSVVIGAGAYVAGPIVWAAKVAGSKVVLLEQNSFPGITNRLLEKKADKIFISYDESKKYFRNQNKLTNFGNPVRVRSEIMDRNKSLQKLGLNDKKTVLILGGSLGAASINKAVEENLDKLLQNDIQIIWQCGKRYIETYKNLSSENVMILDFIENMNEVYSVSDLIVARAGATTIAEIASLGLASILVPSPNVAADHQTKNAQALTNKHAAILLKDSDVQSGLSLAIEKLLNDEELIKKLKQNVKEFASENADQKIADEILKLAESI